MTPQEMASTHAAAFKQSRPWTAAEFADLLDSRFVHYVGTPQSFALFQVIAGEVELLTLATHPTVQRQGLAVKCMENWHSKAVGLGATRAFLDVASDNLAAIALYERCQYRPCGQRKGYYARKNGKSCDAILMECTLP
ncbi:GNAT family N-acetyltransferase [Rhodobacteraceae bacterium B1Z28]|uniref:GNAT family N-acetyltransferase n=1 Tax=Ruegeria haliotis TaxID=2747601 RepID=A0ABX2PS91_9RHOB|nr:GNAT family N-acetyltransferase [Ruegeria haliotis]NVO56521.1 GNAT family N-acetyltransferase [Ruegeria haliotis]